MAQATEAIDVAPRPAAPLITGRREAQTEMLRLLNGIWI